MHTVSDIRSIKKRRRIKRILLATAMFIVAGISIYMVYFSEVLALKTISVQGSKIVKSTDIIQAARIPLGTPLARISNEEILKNLQVFPSVGDVEVRRVWPSEIVLAITERSPVATMAFGARWKFVDQTGVVYGESPIIPEGLIPITADTTVARAAIAEVILALPPSIQRQVLTISAQSEDSVELRLTGNREVLWGNSTQSSRKVSVLEVLLQKKARYFDVSAPNFPTTRN